MPPGEAHVVALSRFPVKACGAESLTHTEVGMAGLPGDRLLAVVVGDQIVTQREHAVLARVRPRLDDATRRLQLSLGQAPGEEPGGLEDVDAVVETDGDRRGVTLFGEEIEVVEQSPELSAWFSELLGTPARLVAAPDGMRRRSPGEVAGETLLSDEGSVSLHSQASLAELNRRLTDEDRPALPGDRFRANIVIDGCPAHAEDDTRRFDIGAVRMRFAQVDERCVVTTVDQRAGRRAGPEPIRTLAAYRRPGSGGVRFGIYTAVVHPGVVAIGDPVLLDGS